MLNQSVFYYLKKVVQASGSKTEISHQKTQIRQCLFLEKGGPTLEVLQRMKRCFMSDEAFHISNAHNRSLRVLHSRSPYSSVQALFCPRIDPKRWLPEAWLMSPSAASGWPPVLCFVDKIWAPHTWKRKSPRNFWSSNITEGRRKFSGIQKTRSCYTAPNFHWD